MKKNRLRLLAAALLLPLVGSAETFSFADATPGAPPPGWLATRTGAGTPKWTVERDPAALTKGLVLRQSGAADYPLCLKTGASLRDGFVEVQFIALSGADDQAGGVVCRARDADNYYVARANALEDNVRIYHVVAGRRGQFGGVNGVKVAPAVWHRLRVDFAGAEFIVSFDGRKLFTARDATFAAPGLVGVWTKADSVTAFAEFAAGGK